MKQVFSQEFMILDGAMGTMLQQGGLALGQHPEALNFTNPQLVQDIHRQYLEAGSQIISANTFGANRYKLEGSGYTVAEVVAQAIQLAKKMTTQLGGLVALDVGPIGAMLEPSGSVTFEAAYDLFREVVVAGRDAGADLVLIETMTDLYEVKAAVLAAKEHCDLPVFVTMTFEERGRTFTGCGLENMALTLSGLGVDAIGINCSLGPKEIYHLMAELATYTDLPLIAKPNAGLPDPETNLYDIDAVEFGQVMATYPDVGVQILGGCCGTNPDFIREMVANLRDKTRKRRDFKPKTKFCSATQVVTVDTVRPIGERLNPTADAQFAKALVAGDWDYLQNKAIAQVEGGAEILDINVGVPGMDEAALMVKAVKSLQDVVDVPLQIDSSNLKALEAGLRVCNGKPILNSVNGEDEKLHSILPLAKKYGAAVVALTIDEDGIPKTAEKRVEIAKKILKAGESYGISRENILVDCLTLTVSAQQDDCLETLRAMSTIQNQLGLELVSGVSNISFGLPNRELMNHSFLALAMDRGLRLPILDPTAKSIMDMISAYKVLSGYDRDCQDYIQRHGDQQKSTQEPTVKTQDLDIRSAVVSGLTDSVQAMTPALLATMSPMELINDHLIPTLDFVGEQYETGVFFLPQLIRSANAACGAFEIIKSELLKTNGGSISKGKIILATVQGDVHDIGKNIVKVILENYGYEIIDLGRDVDPERIVDTAIEQQVSLIGLSALMTTTVGSMKTTIEQLREANHPCQVMVGGAVLTADFAEKIGADFYAKDAMQSVQIAKTVFGA